jgi:hypothetical protein
MRYYRDNSSSSSSAGAGFVEILQVAFIVLKLCRVIDWPWLWVLSPTWITLVIAFIIALVFPFIRLKNK